MGRRANLKTLRRMAERFTVGRPEAAYDVINHKRTVMGMVEQPDGTKVPGPVKVIRRQIVLRPGCTRYAYRALKKASNGGRDVDVKPVADRGAA